MYTMIVIQNHYGVNIQMTFLFFLCYLIFAIWGFFINKESDAAYRIDCLIILSLYSIISSSYSINIFSLYILILMQIITYIICIRIMKMFKKRITYYIYFFIVSTCIIISITCSYGYYYCYANLIDITDIWHIDISNTFISNIINDILTGIYLFIKSLKYYFNFIDEFIPQTQFCIGILISCIILESLFSIIRNLVKYKD